jgi:hypothetical protein
MWQTAVHLRVVCQEAIPFVDRGTLHVPLFDASFIFDALLDSSVARSCKPYTATPAEKHRYFGQEFRYFGDENSATFPLFLC